MNDFKLEILEDVIDKHEDRIGDVINASKLKTISDKWIAASSDFNRDRVYLTDCNSGVEYSIAFSDSKRGYNFIVLERKPIEDNAYYILLENRPELELCPRENLATVEEVDKGFIKAIIYERENYFEKFLTRADIDISEKTGKILVATFFSEYNVSNNIVTVLPKGKMAYVMKMASVDYMNEVIDNFSVMGEYMDDQDTPCVIGVESNIPDLVTKDAINYLFEKGFDVKVALHGDN